MFKKIALSLTVLFASLSFVFQPMTASADENTTASDLANIQMNAIQISDNATIIQAQATEMMSNAQTIIDTENDANVLDAAQQIITLAAQIESDANAIAVTADDINTRIDGSEDTTLQLSQDILTMAGEIGVMADRILYTEGEIGVMADRIVDSENLISASTLDLASSMTAH